MQPVFSQLSVNPQKGITLAHQIKQQITWLMAAGRLEAGSLLPSVRQLARHLGINLHTVRNAYRMLEAEGLVATRHGRGTQVLNFDLLRIAQAAVVTRTHSVGVIMASLTNPFYHAFYQGVAEVADEDQTLLFVCSTQDDPAEAWRYFAQLAVRQVDGILVASHGLIDQIANGLDSSVGRVGVIPFVTVDWPGCNGPCVLIDLEGAGYQATSHLIQHGHSQIGLITYASQIANVKPLYDGYLRALREMDLPSDPSLIARVKGFDSASGAEGAIRLLNQPQPPTAIFAITDMMAAGALQVIRERGLRVPQDVALVGFNDIPQAAWLNPPLTTVAAPAFQLGKEAMCMLQSLIAGRSLAQQQVVLPTSLIIRQSCGVHERELI